MPAGVWIKDTEASDLASYERALDMMGLNGLQKTTALRLIEGLEIKRQGSKITVQFLTVVPFFKVAQLCNSPVTWVRLTVLSHDHPADTAPTLL